MKTFGFYQTEDEIRFDFTEIKHDYTKEAYQFEMCFFGHSRRLVSFTVTA